MIPDSPRFDLHLERERAHLQLASPFERGAIRLRAVEIEVDIGGAGRSVDLRLGAAAFRHRRSKARSLRAELHWPLLVADAGRSEGPEAIRLLDVDAARRALRLRCFDGVRDVTLLLRVDEEGEAVELSVGGAPPHLGLRERLERASGGRLAGLLASGHLEARAIGRLLLAEALLPAGFRVPSVASIPLRLRLDEETLSVEADGDVPPSPPGTTLPPP